MLKGLGFQLVPVSAPEFFADDPENPSKQLIRTILSAIAAFDRMTTVQRLKKARDRKSAELGRRIEGPKVPDEVIAHAKRLHRPHRKTGQRRSLRQIAAELAALGFNGPSGGPYHPPSVKRMLRKG